VKAASSRFFLHAPMGRKVNSMDALLAVLPQDGTWVEFDNFIQQARMAGANVNLYRRAVQSKLIETRIEGEYGNGGVHQVRLVV
jgi:hypothetical protein